MKEKTEIIKSENKIEQTLENEEYESKFTYQEKEGEIIYKVEMKEKTADIDILEEELRKDILYEIDMKLYDEFNDKFCEINENLGTIYTYKDLEDLKKAESDTERRLLRQAISTLISENKELKDSGIELATTIDELQTDLKELKEENQTMALEGSRVRLELYIKENYILKSKVEELLKEIENRNYNDYTGCQDGNELKYNIIQDIKEFLGKE